ncbi:MAG: ECF transporter S component [Erysipelotrichaceae bacterium]|nr:ECF transporter S component [Erysipelotrichaceae bacterium]
MRNANIRKLTGTALLAAIIVVLQTFASGIKFGTFTPTLSLIPIIIGALVYGPLSGAFLGLVFGVIVVIGVLSGSEPMSTLMFQTNPAMTVFLCLLKGAMAGLIPGIIYKVFNGEKNLLATVAATISAPIVNTGIFCAALLTVFLPVTQQFSDALGFANAGKFILLGIVGTNFLFELLLNAILVPIVIRIINFVKK